MPEYNDLAVWLRDEMLHGRVETVDVGLNPGYLAGGPDQFVFIFDGDIDLEKLAAAVLEHVAAKVHEFSDQQAKTTNWDGSPGILGNWVHGIREAGRFVRRGLRDDPRYVKDVEL